MPGSPASRCGKIEAGDVLVSVDGVSVASVSIAQLTNLILGYTCLLMPECVGFENSISDL